MLFLTLQTISVSISCHLTFSGWNSRRVELSPASASVCFIPLTSGLKRSNSSPHSIFREIVFQQPPSRKRAQKKEFEQLALPCRQLYEAGLGNWKGTSWSKKPSYSRRTMTVDLKKMNCLWRREWLLNEWGMFTKETQ